MRVLTLIAAVAASSTSCGSDQASISSDTAPAPSSEITDDTEVADDTEIADDTEVADDTDADVETDTGSDATTGTDPAAGDDEASSQADLLDETSEVFAAFDGDRPGCSVGVRSEGRDHVLSFGMADLAAGDALDETTVYDIGSVSKQMTAGAIALLVLDGQIGLDDDITDWLDVGPYDSTITVSDLVHHTSGLPDYIEQLDADDSEVTTNDDALRVMTDGADDQPMFDPGTDFDYSNTNYVLLSELVDAASGRSLVEFAHDELFVPLGMDHAAFRDDQGTLLDDQAQGYEEIEGTDGDGFAEVGSAWRQTGDGAVHAPVGDLLAWADAFLDPSDGDGVGSSTWVEMMTMPGAAADVDGTDYGFGLELADGRLSHGGSWIGYSSAIVMDPDLGVAVAIACNLDGVDAESLADEVMAIWT